MELIGLNVDIAQVLQVQLDQTDPLNSFRKYGRLFWK